MKKKVLLIGSAGRIGTGFIEDYNQKYSKDYELILGVHKKSARSKLKQVHLDISNLNSLKKAMRGISVVVNLAANPSAESSFKDLLTPNIIGAYNVFEAAKQSKCDRVIFASSIHAVNGYGKNTKVKPENSPKPMDLYGASKAFGEALCFVFSKYLSCFAIRIGAYISDNQKKIICPQRTNFDYVVSQRDLSQLIHRSIMAPKNLKYAILSGSSEGKTLDLNKTKKLLGYKPQDKAETICKILKKK